MSTTESSTADHQAADTGTSGPTSAILSVQAKSPQTINGPEENIQGLLLRLPPASRQSQALLTLSVTAPYANGLLNGSGIQFRINVGSQMVAQGAITAVSGTSTGRSPISMTVAVPLQEYSQEVTASWASTGNVKDGYSTGYIDSMGYASLSAVLG